MLHPGVAEMCLTPSGGFRYVSFGPKTKFLHGAQPQTTTLILGL